LLAAGAREVDVWCFARASRDDMFAGDIPSALLVAGS
jgi:hypothetical protein